LLSTAALALACALAACTEDPTLSAGEVQRVVVSPSSLALLTGQSGDLNATALTADGAAVGVSNITWSSDNASVATVDEQGTVTAVAPGSATVSARVGNVAGSASVAVTPQPPTGPVVDVYPAVTHQTMTGWEAVTQSGEVDCNPIAFQNYRNKLLDDAVNDLGLNRLRLQVRSGAENPVDWFSKYLAKEIDYTTLRAHWYEIQNDNSNPQSLNAAGFQWSFLDHTIDNVVTPMRQRVIARGERLFINLNYVDFGTSPFEHSSNPAEYAELIVAIFQHIQSKYGWVPDAVEMILEPDITPNWRAATIGAALVATGDRLAAAGYHPAFIAPSNTNMSAAITYFDGLVQIPRVREYLTDFSYHRYAGVSQAAVKAIGDRASQFGVRTGMLEHIGSGYEDLHEDLLIGRNSSWQQFALGYCTGDDGAQYYTINQSNPAAPVVVEGSRTRFLKQYFRHVRLDAVRIGAASGDDRFSPIAFRNTDGKVVVVIKATAGGSLQIRGLPTGTYGMYYATNAGSGVLQDGVVSGQGALAVTVPAGGVVTAFRR
jgi:Big-like domain-containing protein